MLYALCINVIMCMSVLVSTTGNAADPAAAADCSSGQTAATAAFQ